MSSWIATLALALLLVATSVAAEEFKGEVVGVTDGDTIRVLRDGRAVLSA